MFIELLIKKFFQSCSARPGFTPMCDAFAALRVLNNLLDQVFYVKSKSIASTSNTTFWWALQTQIEWTIFKPAEHTIWVSRNSTLRIQYLHLGNFLWKQYIILASYKDFCKLQFSFFMYSFPHTNVAFLFRHLPNEIVIFINVCYQMKSFSGDSFSFL